MDLYPGSFHFFFDIESGLVYPCVNNHRCKRAPISEYVSSAFLPCLPQSTKRGVLMIESEQRDAIRMKRKADILLENFPTGAYYKAKMYNYSRGGMYFESDYAPLPGSEIYIGIENSPYDYGPDMYRAQVRWRCQLPAANSGYAYGVGVKYHYPIEV
jgi:hypothetical protein